jgi:hypothetical protein
MNKHRLKVECLKVESFGTSGPGDLEGCVCDYPPCICTAGEDCTTGTSA